jgi:serine/threonine protein kinase
MKARYTEKSDQYELGLLALEMLLGKPPVEVRCAADFAAKKCFFESPGEFMGQIPHQELGAVLLKMLCKAPSDRYDSMKHVSDALKRLEPAATVAAKESYRKHCYGNREFYREFYDRFFGKCPQARTMFGSVEQQYSKLDLALQSVLNFGAQDMAEPTVLTSVAITHQKLRVSSEQLDLFSECLLQTLREFSQESELTLERWREVLLPGVNYLKKHMS